MIMSSIPRSKSSSDYEVAELRWENGEIVAMNGLGSTLQTSSTKQTWGGLKAGDTLESLVHQATSFPQLHDHADHGNDHQVRKCSSTTFMPAATSNSGGKWRESPSCLRRMNIIESINNEEGNMMRSLSYMGDQMEANSAGGKQMELKAAEQRAVGSSMGVSSAGKYGEDSSPSSLIKKRVRERVENYCGSKKFQVDEDQGVTEVRGRCASESGRDDHTETTIMTWPSFESPPIFSSHGASENQDGEPILNGESFRSQSSARNSHAAAVHNQSERRRRERINQKMKALQKLVPNASKTDKASMLDEVIEYLQQLQAQVRMMNNARNLMPQMMMPLGMQQQLQMSYLARMGMGMGMVDVNNLARNVHHSTLYPLAHASAPLGGTTPSFVSPPFAMPQVVPPPTSLKGNIDADNANTFVPNLNEAYRTLLVQQSMNMEFLNRMAAFYREQANQRSNYQSASQSQTMVSETKY